METLITELEACFSSSTSLRSLINHTPQPRVAVAVTAACLDRQRLLLHAAAAALGAFCVYAAPALDACMLRTDYERWIQRGMPTGHAGRSDVTRGCGPTSRIYQPNRRRLGLGLAQIDLSGLPLLWVRFPARTTLEEIDLHIENLPTRRCGPNACVPKAGPKRQVRGRAVDGLSVLPDKNQSSRVRRRALR